MKRLLPLLMVFLVGCAGPDPAMDAALDLRSRCLSSPQVEFWVQIYADYISQVEEFTLDCAQNGETLSFRVAAPEDIGGICGTVRGSEGSVRFDDAMLAFPLMADGRLSPLSGPWVVMKAIRTGNILAAGREGELIHLVIDDSYEENALTVDLWLDGGAVSQAEVAWEGRRCLAMTFDGFSA